MRLKLIAIAGLITLAVPAHANSGAGVEVAPGYWNWSHDTTLAAISFSEENTECLSPNAARVSRDEIASDLDSGCRISQATPIPDGYDFTLTCSGFYSGEATGTLRRLSAHQLSMEATGRVVLAGIGANFAFEASANRVGDCPN